MWPANARIRSRRGGVELTYVGKFPRQLLRNKEVLKKKTAQLAGQAIALSSSRVSLTLASMTLERQSQVENELHEVRAQLEEKERDAREAAEFGQRLLETNHDLQNRLEEIGEEYADKIEVWENKCFMEHPPPPPFNTTHNRQPHETMHTMSLTLFP